MRTPSTFLLLLAAHLLHAQTWELVTPVKTRSDLAAVHLHSPTDAITIDRTLGYVLRTSDAGDSWDRMPFNMIDVPRCLVMFDDQRGIIGADIGRFYRTTNNWNSFTTVILNGFGNAGRLSFVNDQLGWAASESGKIARTTDGGATWTLQTSGTTNALVGLYFVNDTLGFASGTGAVLLRTSNGGDTWSPITAPITYNMRAFHFFDAFTGLAVGIGGEIIRTTDAGLTWTQQPSPTTNSLLNLFVRDNLLIAVGNGGVVMRSTNGGDTWSAQVLETNQDLYSAYIDPSGIGLLTGEARVYRTTDHGATWTAVQIGTFHTKLTKVSFGTDQLGAAAGWQTMGGLENGVVRTTDGGRHWANATTGSATWGGIHLRADGVGWLGGGVGANRSTSNYFATSTNHPGPNVAIRSTWAFSASTAIVGGGYVNGGCYRTTNGGSTWQQVLTGGNIYDIWFVNDQLGFCGGQGGGLARTTDGGITWEWLTSPTNSDIHSLFFLNDTLGYFAGNGGARTTDGGDTWTLLPELPQFTMSIFFTDPDTGYAVQYSGYVLRTTDGGDSWDEVVPAPFDVGMNDAQLVDGALLAVGDHGDVFRAALGCPTTPHIPAVLQSGNTLCTAYRPTIQWYLNGEPLPTATWPCITATEPGTYTVVVTDALGCTSAPSAPVQVVITDVETPTTAAPLLYPNPGTGTYQLRFAEVRPRLLQLHDLQGRLLLQQRSTGPSTLLTLEHLPAGLYVLSAEGEGWGMRVVKE
ncbi:MAG: T9SS type A sorting domain-containing protein [Flavobacteriales bacterium]|nr:T9SS type A sorting domain-containing protein [Flavobacteriales bacterium]